MAVTRISEMNVYPLRCPEGYERTMPCLFAEGKDTASGDGSGGATFYKPRITNARTKYGDYHWMLDIYRYHVVGAVAQDISVQLPYSAWENYYNLASEVELFSAAAVAGQTSMIAPGVSVSCVRRFIGRLIASTDTVEIQMKSSVNTNGVKSIVYIALYAFKERPLLLNWNTQ